MNEPQPNTVINLSAAIQQELDRLRGERVRIERALLRQRMELGSVDERLALLSSAAALYPHSIPFVHVLDEVISPPQNLYGDSSLLPTQFKEVVADLQEAVRQPSLSPVLGGDLENEPATEVSALPDGVEVFTQIWQEKAAAGLAKLGLTSTQQTAAVSMLDVESAAKGLNKSLEEDLLTGFTSPKEVDPVRTYSPPIERPEALSTPAVARKDYQPVGVKRAKSVISNKAVDDSAAIDAFIREQGVSKCPTGFVGESTGKISAEDRAAIAAHAARQQEAARQKPVKGSWSRPARPVAGK